MDTSIGQTKPMSQIEGLLTEQYRLIEKFEAAIDRAREAFAGVLDPPPCAGQKENPPEPERSPMGNMLSGHNRRIDVLVSELEDLTRRSAV